ncbi:putative Cell division control protein [Taphrina deformans PYCC 5710]|uniref:Cell division control protein n=1 Tax=Taphrina deformans (strain PYCC 5710 / ATCC 11124 / CBS 356.35 / IMI 108563 / JCM 9778 / NBRC 8474) TaxID=1097556 RepID=R4ZY10_TAPDE|nr:putative Cell division control protein [Taphrina deformans PYCC 5710]|eukprot:CCX35413.1 putative Cell division control protein [Taphrina deformans PYCC 5710]
MAIVKGGVWTNVEDEILKAAISKYGKNQWARISSLLVRKTPKQCKARWYEWLDPGIKKVDWTREEDEKLLHLAKLLPTQWRTIAPIVGRTSTQCLERYQKLLDDAEAAENSELGLSGVGAEGAAPTADSVRRLRAGETDPNPETKPAKPDAIDMDEDEKEMLSEARARLANTQGKKAKRKQREKLLEETKRLSVIQKRRDLKAAGINIKLHHRKKGEMDYNADIPFEHKPALGFYDTTEEAGTNERERKLVDFRQVEQKRREDDAAKEERKNPKKREGEVTDDVAAQAVSLEKLRKAEQLTKRRKLNLPGPQVSDRELEDIIKLGLTSTDASEIANEGEASASRGLIGNYTSVGTGQPVRTPRTPATHDSINLEARNLRAMTSTQSSLLGAENTPLHGAQAGTGYDAATPRNSLVATPNPLRREAGAETPVTHGSSYVTSTPRRDNLSLNSASPYDETPGQMTVADEKLAAKTRASQLRSQFAALPAPKNDFELELPQEEDEAVDLSNDALEDSAERDARAKQAQEEQAERARQQRTSVLQQGLPRPQQISVDLASVSSIADSDPEALIQHEMRRLLISDAIKFPISGSSTSRGTVLPDVDLSVLQAVRSQILTEAGQAPLHNDLVNGETSTARTIPGMEIYLDDEDGELQACKTLLPDLNKKLQGEASKSARLEKKMSLVLGGYQKRAQTLSDKLRAAGTALQEAEIVLNSFKMLQENESSGIITRIEVLESEVKRLETLQRNGQELYVSLSNRKEEFFHSSS